MLHVIFVLVWCIIGGAFTNPPSDTPATTQAAVLQKLASVEEQLRTVVEAINAGGGLAVGARSTTRATSASWNDAGLDALVHRLEAIETRLGRLDTLIELRLDKLSERVSQTVGGQQMKDELATEQLGRKLDAAADRLNHRLGYLDARVDTATTKILARFDALPRELQRSSNAEHSCCHQLQVAVGASESRLRAQVDRLSEQLRVSQQSGAQSDGGMARWDASEHAQNLSRALKDVLKTGRDKMLESIDIETKNAGIKVTGMCNELWRRTQGIEELVKQSVAVSNSTQRYVHDALRNTGRSRHDTSPATAGPDVEEMSNRLQRRMTDLGRRLDSSFQMMMLAQNMFLESCHRIQLGEPRLEERLSLVLERMLDAMNNRSTGLNNELRDIRDAIQSQSGQISRSLSLLRTAVMQASEQSNLDSKSIARAIENLGGLVEERFAQVLVHTPNARVVANLIIQDLKPILVPHVNLSYNDTAATPTPPPLETTSNTTASLESIRNETAETDDDLTPDEEDDITEELNHGEEELEVPVAENSLFTSQPDQDFDAVGLWKSMGDNVSLAEILRSMMSRDMSPPSIFKLDEERTDDTTEDYMIANEPEQTDF